MPQSEQEFMKFTKDYRIDKCSRSYRRRSCYCRRGKLSRKIGNINLINRSKRDVPLSKIEGFLRWFDVNFHVTSSFGAIFLFKFINKHMNFFTKSLNCTIVIDTGG